jgi:serine/threonine protein phosphatase PrpC
LLRGREHGLLGAVDAVAERGAAIALSRGGAPKRYAYREPNEDAAAFAWGEAGAFAAVADGHGGFEASEIALTHLLGEPATQWTEAPGALDGDRFRRQALAAIYDASRAIEREGRRPEARTTLSFAVLLPAAGRVLHAAIGDSHIFLAGENGVHELAPAGEGVGFLGAPDPTPETLSALARIGEASLDGVQAIVLATDGLSEVGVGVEKPAHAVADALRHARSAQAGAPALEMSRRLAETALAAQRRQRSGDNVAVATLWLSRVMPAGR